MRLTLRTMLAYLDNTVNPHDPILLPEDAEILGRKIEESDFASGLVRRIRSSVRRERLGAPALHGKGIGLDANTVAEYLDNVLPPDRVPHFEKVCLESDVHLAEVAASHQILTIVLGRRAEVSRALRKRAYLAGSPNSKRDVEAAPTSVSPHADGVAVADPQPALAVTDIAPQPAEAAETSAAGKKKTVTVPDYLKAGKEPRYKSIAIALAIAFLASVIFLRILGPFNSQHPIARLFGGGAEVVQNDTPAIPANEPETNQPIDQTPSETAKTDSSDNGDDSVAAKEEPENGKPVAEPKLPQDDEKTDAAPPEAGPTKPEMVDDKPADEPNIKSEPADSKSPDGKVGSDAEDGTSDQPTKEVVDNKKTDKPEPAVASPVEVGHVKFTERQFLMLQIDSGNDWARLPASSKLMSGSVLKVLPTYRPEIVLAPSVIRFLGKTDALLLPPSPSGEPRLMMPYGRAVISTPGVPGARVHLEFGGSQATITFVEATTEVAVEVGRYLRPGANPEREPAQTVIQLFTIAGRIELQADPAGPATSIPADRMHTMIGQQGQTLQVTSLPPWLSAENVSDIDSLASRALEPFIREDKSVMLSLRERAEDRKSEVRSLASRCLAFLNSFDSIIKEFNDDSQKSYWAAEFEALRNAVSRGAEPATAVREALERGMGDDAAVLYRMLWGYSPQQLKEGGAAELVQALDSPTLIIRVFAFENLRQITNKTLSYRPEWTDTRRRSSVQDWRQRLEAGEIIYHKLPSPVEVR